MRNKFAIFAVASLAMAAAITGCGGKKDEPINNTGAVASVEAKDEAKGVAKEEAKEVKKAPQGGAVKENKAVSGDKKSESPEASEEEYQGYFILDETLTCRFESDDDYSLDNYASIAKRGDMSEGDIDNFMEYASDLLAFNFQKYDIPMDYIYGPNTTQCIISEEDNSKTRIVSASTMTGDAKMDAIMNKVGYEDYYVDYFYSFGAFEPAGEDYNKPVMAKLIIGDNAYEYYFCNNQLVKRMGPEGESNNPETNDFMNGVYRLGCHYGEVLQKERNVYDLFVTSPESYEETEESMIVRCGVQGREGEYGFIIDEYTDWSDDCEKEWFAEYKNGETPYEWFRKMYKIYKEDGEAGELNADSAALMGIFDIKATGEHVDYVRGTYWWD